MADFDRIARAYRWLEYLSMGRALERCRFYRLPQLTGARRALVYGDGDGRFLERLLVANSGVTVDAVDSSGAMLRLLAERVRRVEGVAPLLGGEVMDAGASAGPTQGQRPTNPCSKPTPAPPVEARDGAEALVDVPGDSWPDVSGEAGSEAVGRVRLHQADALGFAPPRLEYDLVVAHFFLDCFTAEELAVLLGRVVPCLAPGAMLLVSEFAVPRGRVAGWAGRALISLLYRVFGVVTGLRTRRLPRYAELLKGCGFRLMERREFLGGLLVSELWRFGSAASA